MVLNNLPLGTIRVLAKVLQEEVGTVSWDLGEFCPDAASRRAVAVKNSL